MNPGNTAFANYRRAITGSEIGQGSLRDYSSFAQHRLHCFIHENVSECFGGFVERGASGLQLFGIADLCLAALGGEGFLDPAQNVFNLFAIFRGDFLRRIGELRWQELTQMMY